MIEQVKVIADAAYPLDGVITLPDDRTGKVPAVVLVHGSGPQDMDETVGACKPFRDLAEGLAKHGIASLRYEKRTYAYGKRMVEELGGSLSVKEEVIEDAIAAAKLLKADPRVDAKRVFIAGHSLGGMLAPRIDNQGGDFAGLVIMAGTIRTLDEVILDQNADALKLMDEAQRASVLPQVEALKKQFDTIGGMTDEEAQQSILVPQSNIYAWYLKEMKRYPARKYLKKLQKPVFVLQGDKDVHVSVEKDFEQYRETLLHNSSAVCKLYPGLNHLFMKAIYGTIKDVLEEYKVPQIMDSLVVEDLARWILSV